MNRESGMLLLDAVPAIKAGLYRCGRPQGAETQAEIVQDAVCMAAKMIDSCEARGRPVIPGSVAYYAVQASRTGRRSQSSGICDAMGARTRAAGRSRLVSTEEKMSPSDPESLVLDELLADPRPDPATEAAKRLDWDRIEPRLDPRAGETVRATAAGESVKSLARKLGVSSPAVVKMKRRAAAAVLDAWGCANLSEALMPEPAWRRQVVNA